MSWSPRFIAALSTRTIEPRFIAARVDVYGTVGEAWSIGSHRGLGADEVVIVQRGLRLQGGTLSPRTWTATLGGAALTIADPSQVLKRWPRGTVVRILAGFGGMPIGDFEAVFVGVVRGLRGVGPTWELELLDLVSACRTRLYRAVTNPRIPLLGSSVTTTLTSGASVGAGTYHVASTVGFARELTSSTGGTAVGALRVNPSSGGDPYYRLWSATSSTTFTIHDPSTSSLLGTSDVGASSGDEVEGLAYFHGHPVDIVRSILTSQERGNGTFDRLPASWGVGLSSGLVDGLDMLGWRAVLQASSGDYVWRVAQRDPADDVGSWMAGWLAPAGLFLAARQGGITVRAAQNTLAHLAGAPAHLSGLSITDDDIVSVDDYDAWDADHLPEYAAVRVRSVGGSTVSAPIVPSSSPHEGELEYDLSGALSVNEAPVRAEVLARLAESARRLPERVTVTCGGLRLSQAAVGDLVDFTTRRVRSRALGHGGYDGRQAMVVEASPDWATGRTRVAMVVYPTSESAP